MNESLKNMRSSSWTAELLHVILPSIRNSQDSPQIEHSKFKFNHRKKHSTFRIISYTMKRTGIQYFEFSDFWMPTWENVLSTQHIEKTMYLLYKTIYWLYFVIFRYQCTDGKMFPNAIVLFTSTANWLVKWKLDLTNRLYGRRYGKRMISF